ncbi:hypothetical protein NYR90_00155 [Clostridioides difficile]|nr:hypothetical protein NYR90_00155 [Clostridioides difficile]
MAKFKKRPVEVEAFRLGYDIEPEWFIGNSRVCNFKWINGHVSCDLETLEGTVRANKGDYIIQGVKGEIYPRRADIFEMTYQKVEYTATIENLTNYAENLEQKHRYIDKEKVKKNNLELSAKIKLDTTDFEENIRSATKEIETFNEVVYRLEENLNRVFGKEKLNEIKIKIKSPTKQLSDEDLEYIRETAYKDVKARFAKEGKTKINY